MTVHILMDGTVCKIMAKFDDHLSYNKKISYNVKIRIHPKYTP